MSCNPGFRVGRRRKTGDGRGLRLRDRYLDPEGPVGSTDDAISGIGVRVSLFHALNMVRARDDGYPPAARVRRSSLDTRPAPA